MDERRLELSNYRINQAQETLEVAEECLDKCRYRDAINRSYYSAFYSIKSILALEKVDFKRHKDVMAYFNKTYVATEIFPKALGKRIGSLQKLREASDYDDFYVASKEEALTQFNTANELLNMTKDYLIDIKNKSIDELICSAENRVFVNKDISTSKGKDEREK